MNDVKALKILLLLEPSLGMDISQVHLDPQLCTSCFSRALAKQELPALIATTSPTIVATPTM